MRKQKIYLETTMFNYYFDIDRDAHKDTVKLFEEIGEGLYEAFTSVYVITELANATEPKRSLMLNLISQFNVSILDLSDEAENLAKTYVTEKVIPQKFFTDAIHIAVATVYNLDMILSLNFQHIVKKKTIEMTEVINTREGYRNVQIYTPMEVVEYD